MRLKRGARRKQTDIQDTAALGQPVRRAAGVRNARHRMQGNINRQQHDEDNRIVDEDNDNTDDKTELPDYKIGAKKRAKLAAKAEKKLQREAAERDREERKKREQLVREEKDKQAEKELAERLRMEEEERKAREEKEKREYEEYLRIKEAFSVEEEGYHEENKEDKENLLQKFIQYIKQNKVLILEDLAAHFGLKTSNVIERIQELRACDRLTGVIDDRGKFIYISENELQTVVKFVQQRGRVSIAELVENSNNLISLAPVKS
ncbi:DDRGK domain-containing protein 1-like isoform X2 [Harpegnathos saltator]|uniref:DDRGK domain-containing protein 1 isoform X2 n=1 Tax=Harpegnathos saltator TaxID=610380 RepID=UPI000DBED3F0|nr:DDRGK domain-containing protein 1 isoform X2 [Harpegnathos saltator]XP_025162732.1 DDRGK domain-containing protein 1-like isoform X2 [Harpegnathos saltator]